MKKESAVLAALGLTVFSVVVLAGCTSPRGTDESAQPVGWNIKWDSVSTAADGEPLAGPVTYVVQSVDSANGGDWQDAWTGTTNVATIQAAPGRRCFRAFAVNGIGTRSAASQVICATKTASVETRDAAVKSNRRG